MLSAKDFFWHGSDLPHRKLRFGYDGGVHLGSRKQAEMRNSAFLHKCRFLGDATKLRRSKDEGLDWRGKIRSARNAGFDGIVYLNRYEGMSNENISILAQHDNPEKLSDAEFRKLITDAQDSLISLDESSVIVDEITPGTGRVRLFHGTSRENAEAMLKNGYDPDGWRAGPNQGRKGLLYLTSDPLNARWFADQCGDGAVIEVRPRARDLMVDPEDGSGGSVIEEMMSDLPALLATRTNVPAPLISLHEVDKIPLFSLPSTDQI